MEKKKIIVGVIDGQGASVGKYIVERLRDRLPGIYIRALGTTSLATGKMLTPVGWIFLWVWWLF